MKPLLDINIVLDVLLVRQPWFADSASIWDAHRNGEISAAIAAFTVPTVFYVMRRQTNVADAHVAVGICITMLDIAPVLESTLQLAQTLPAKDYEDNLQMACAIEAQRDSIVTRNPADFANAPLPVFTPAQFLAALSQRKK